MLLTVDLERLEVRPGELLLDAGCGEGRHCYGALERGARVVGLDLDSAGLRAAVGGLLLAVTGVVLPRIVMEPIEMLGAMAIPLLLLNLGMHLRSLVLREIRHTVVVVAIRVMGGAACAVLFIALFGVTGVERKVLLLASIMPAAVINVIIAQRYSTDPSLVASAVALGTLVSLVTIPAMLYFAG